MKKVTLALLILFAAVLILPSCKKGENDPSITFKSRDGRLAQKWKLTKIEATSVSSGGTTQTITYDGTILTASWSTGGSATGTGTYEMTIDKKGNVSWTENFTLSGGTADVRTGEGHWIWLSSNKNRDWLNIDGGYNLFSGGSFYIDRLSGKDLVLKYSSKDVDNGTTTSSDETYTFTKQ